MERGESMKVIVGILFGWLLVVAAIGLIVWSGSYNVAATNPPGRFEKKFAAFALNRAIQKRAPVRTNPFSKPEDIRAGLAHYKENCVDCHGAPGVEESEFGEGLNPPAPDLTLPAMQRMRDGELFWVVSNGIRMTGMPAFSPTHKEDEIWKSSRRSRPAGRKRQATTRLNRAARPRRKWSRRSLPKKSARTLILPARSLIKIEASSRSPPARICGA